MDELVKKRFFLRLQFFILLLLCTFLPEFSLKALMEVPDLDFPVIFSQVAGVAGTGWFLYAFYKELGESFSLPYGIVTAVALFLTLLTWIFDMPVWINYLILLLLAYTFFTGKGYLKIKWDNDSRKGVYIIFMAVLVRVYDGVADTLMSQIVAIVALIYYFIGLSRFRRTLDESGVSAATSLKISLILNLIALLIGWIPLFGVIVGGILLIIAFFLEYMAYGQLKKSASLNQTGHEGARQLQMAMILLLIGAVIGLIPFMGGIESYFSLASLILMFLGWERIFIGIENR